ncbi:MAG: glycosyltransferase family 39 protein [Pirellulales bacterium]|nr:glycosyltransferase family 39 protein [Pirellulales bacterium]
MPASTRRFVSWGELAAIALLALIASGLLFWHLGRRYLWQDEAATGVLAERMLEFGRPLGYDGRNLITMDVTADRDRIGLERRIRDPEVAIAYFVARGDFKPDTTWIGQPWGQFVLTAASFQVFGKGTLAARIPFALCGLLTVAILYRFIRREFDDPWMAWIAGFLLATNVFWVLHMRQCRYYAPSCLFMLLTVLAYLRWQTAGRGGAILFVLTSWIWFQFDYGTFWPVIGLLFLDGVVCASRSRGRVLLVFAAIGFTVAPWVWYYELFSRLKETIFDWRYRSAGSLFNFNQYVIPWVLLVLAVWLLWYEWSKLRPTQRRFLFLSAAILVINLVWVTVVAPAPYLRYIVGSTPFAAALLAFVCVRGLPHFLPEGWLPWRSWGAIALAALLTFSPFFSRVGLAVIPKLSWRVEDMGYVARQEWRWLYLDLADVLPDPNRDLIELLRPRLRPEDEILITYEDVPLMFYLPNRVRGGTACFRLLSEGPPPRFLVSRSMVPYLDFQFEALNGYVGRQRWYPVEHRIVDTRAGNCPDPTIHFARDVGDGQFITVREHAWYREQTDKWRP